MPFRSRSQYLESPPYNRDGSDDAGNRQGALQDMDLHCFHPVFFATPRGRYVIPQYAGNVGVAERTSIEARPVYHAGTWAEDHSFPRRCQDKAGRQILAKRMTLAGPNG
jgi:hypothetical protein